MVPLVAPAMIRVEYRDVALVLRHSVLKARRRSGAVVAGSRVGLSDPERPRGWRMGVAGRGWRIGPWARARGKRRWSQCTGTFGAIPSVKVGVRAAACLVWSLPPCSIPHSVAVVALVSMSVNFHGKTPQSDHRDEERCRQ